MLTLENISFEVNDEKGEKEIIKNLSFTVGDGKFVVITGPNGGGKSTTAKLIMGIERPGSGHIYFDGKEITDMSITDRANLGISFAFQQPVRFKGVQVIDLLRLAAKKKLTIAEACQYRRGGGALRQGLYQPGGECQPFGGRAEADRDCNGAGPLLQTFGI